MVTWEGLTVFTCNILKMCADEFHPSQGWILPGRKSVTRTVNSLRARKAHGHIFPTAPSTQNLLCPWEVTW